MFVYVSYFLKIFALSQAGDFLHKQLAMPKYKMNIVDVRDVAACHVLALTLPRFARSIHAVNIPPNPFTMQAANQRIILNAGSQWLTDLWKDHNSECSRRGTHALSGQNSTLNLDLRIKPFSEMTAPRLAVMLMALFDEDARNILPHINKDIRFNTDKVENEFTDVR